MNSAKAPNAEEKWSIRGVLRQKWTLKDVLYLIFVGGFVMIVGVAYFAQVAMWLYAEVLVFLGYGHSDY